MQQLICRGDVYKLFENTNGIARLHVADIDLIPVVTMEEQCEPLYQHIMQRKRDYTRSRQLWGDNHPILTKDLWEIYGLEKAYELMTGKSFTDHLIESAEETLSEFNNRN